MANQQEPKSHSGKVIFLVLAVELLREASTHRRFPAAALPVVSQQTKTINPSTIEPVGPTGAHVLVRFWRFLTELWGALNTDRIFAVSAGVAFYGLLSLVPGLAALISIYGLFTDRATIINQVGKIAQVLPAEIASVIGDQAMRIANQPAKTLGFALLVSFVLSLWSSNAATKAGFDALNVAFETPEKRGTIGLNLQTIGFTLAGLVIALLAMAAAVIMPLILNHLWLGTVIETLLKTLVWPLFLLAVSLAIAAVYRFGASHTHPQWRWATPGVAFATLSWGGLSLLFSWYAANFGKFNETYGSLGAAAVLMTWLWLSALLVLTGAEIDSIFYDEPQHNA